MNYFDVRTSRALLDNRLERVRKTSQQRKSGFAIITALKERVGVWMIARGEKLVSNEPKIA